MYTYINMIVDHAQNYTAWQNESTKIYTLADVESPLLALSLSLSIILSKTK